MLAGRKALKIKLESAHGAGWGTYSRAYPRWRGEELLANARFKEATDSAG